MSVEGCPLTPLTATVCPAVVTHIINITYQRIETSVLKELLGFSSDRDLGDWLKANNWREESGNMVFINNQEENIKTKNIQERIEFDTVAPVLALYR